MLSKCNSYREAVPSIVKGLTDFYGLNIDIFDSPLNGDFNGKRI